MDYLSALLTPTIAILGSIIAYYQWRTNTNRLKHELFERRYEQFSVIRDFLGSIMASGKATHDEQIKYLSGTRGIAFIFDREIAECVDKTIWHLAVDLECLESELQGVPVGEVRSRNVLRQAEIKKQLMKELQSLEDRFSKYLQLRH